MVGSSPSGGALARRLGLADATVLGVASMLGAGVFVAFAPAARAAGDLLLLALALAGAVAAANAHSSARLAARYPESGGTYVYARERLGMPWGHLAGWAFVVGKTASCAAMALTVGAYLLPAGQSVLAVIVVLVVLALNLQGVQRSARVAGWLTAGVALTILVFVLAMAVTPPVVLGDGLEPVGAPGPIGVAQGAGFLFFAFAGYARVATVAEEVRDPARTVPRAMGWALAAVLALYAVVALAFLLTVGSAWLAGREAPLAEAAEISGWSWAGPVLRVAAGLAAGGALLVLVLGVSRTVLAMARDGHLPKGLAAVTQTHQVPARAEIAVAVAVVLLVVFVDTAATIALSSFCVLVYYALANASAWTLAPGLRARLVPALGLVGTLSIALLLPWRAVLAGVLLLAVGALVGLLRHSTRVHDADGPTLGRG